MGKGRYNLLWESHYIWITSVKGDKHKAFCKLCLKKQYSYKNCPRERSVPKRTQIILC